MHGERDIRIDNHRKMSHYRIQEKTYATCIIRKRKNTIQVNSIERQYARTTSSSVSFIRILFVFSSEMIVKEKEDLRFFLILN